MAGTGDYNGDGKADLMFQNTNTGEVYELQMNGPQILAGLSITQTGTDWHIV